MKLAVLVPCHNEEATIGRVVHDFRGALPGAEIWVCDNASNDGTAEEAREAGARLVEEPRPGKGHAIRRLFSEVEADVYVMVDGDATYDAAAAPAMIDLLCSRGLDMVVGNRLDAVDHNTFRPGHHFGNHMFSSVVRLFFGSTIEDLFSGYRVFSRRFVKSFPAQSRGFEIETELTVLAMESRSPVAEVPTRYSSRPEGSSSKLSTVKDGLRILRTVFTLLRDVKPLEFFGTIASLLGLASVIAGIPIARTFLEQQQVPRFPTVVVLTGMFVLAVVCLTCGIILDRVAETHRSQHRLAYLRHASPRHLRSPVEKEKGGAPSG